MEEGTLSAAADLKNILIRLEKEKNYTLAQQATIELFKCYALLDNIQRNRDVICVDSHNLEIFITRKNSKKRNITNAINKK